MTARNTCRVFQHSAHALKSHGHAHETAENGRSAETNCGVRSRCSWPASHYPHVCMPLCKTHVTRGHVIAECVARTNTEVCVGSRPVLRTLSRPGWTLLPAVGNSLRETHGRAAVYMSGLQRRSSRATTLLCVCYGPTGRGTRTGH
eukprot:695411-Prymnesium_polylepis.1